MDSNLMSNTLYTVLVAGDVDMNEYDINKNIKPYVAYKYDERHEIRQQAIKMYKEIVKNNLFTTEYSMFNDFLSLKLQDIEEMTDEEYFESVTEGMIFDKENGNALISINPNGKFSSIKNATIETALPLKGDFFECKVKDVINKTATIDDIERNSEHWDRIMESAPMVKKQYLEQYGNKDTYVKVMSEPFFYNAFVSENTGWVEPSCNEQLEWILNFKERFINNLHEEIILKVYNFTR